MSAAPSTEPAQTILRHAEQAIDRGEKSAARLFLNLLEEGGAFGSLFAAQILRERLNPPTAARVKLPRAA